MKKAGKATQKNANDVTLKTSQHQAQNNAKSRIKTVWYEDNSLDS